MKKAVMCLCSFVLIMVLLMIFYTLHGRSIRQTELDNALDSAMEKAMEMLQADQYVPESDEEWAAQFLEAMALQIDSSSELTVDILDIDHTKGLLSAEAVLRFQHPIGTEGSVSAKNTMILESYHIEEQKNTYSIKFMVNGEAYKSYQLQEGCDLIDPVAPTQEGRTFTGWEDTEGNPVMINGMVADQDYIFIADFTD